MSFHLLLLNYPIISQESSLELGFVIVIFKHCWPPDMPIESYFILFILCSGSLPLQTVTY
jgi:hypothetical protein